MVPSIGNSVSSTGTRRMWFLALFLAFGLSTSTLAKSVVSSNRKVPFSLEEIFDSAPKAFSARWISGTEIEYKNRTTGNVMVHDVTTNSTRVFLDSSVLKRFNATSYKFSPDSTHVLIGYDEKKHYRHSAISKFVVYSLVKKTYTDVAERKYLQHAAWNPKRNSLLFIANNTMYYIEDLTKVNQVLEVSRRGTPNVVFHGISDWVYEEEILGTGVAYMFSPDGRRILYLTIDDSNVTETSFTTYGEPGSLKDQYTSEERIRYPKPGTTIPKFEVSHYDLLEKTGKRLSTYESDHKKSLVYGWRWVSNDTVSIVYSNRVQNVTETEMCDLRSNECFWVTTDCNSKGWANFDVPFFSEDGRTYIERVRREVDGVEYYQIELTICNGTKYMMTNEPTTVRKIIDWNREEGIIYYKASLPGQPSTDHVFSISSSGEPFCLTCDMRSPEGIPCRSADVKHNRDFSYFIGYCYGPAPASVAVYTVAPCNLNRTIVLDDNSSTRKLLAERLLPKVMNLKVNVTESFEAEVRLFLPPDIDMSGCKKYPLLIYVYGGPDADQINDAFLWNWSLYLTTNRSVIYGMIDGRGSGRKGTDMMYAVYRSLGTVEIQDQIFVTKYIRNKFPFIDPKRVGIWGWSYGGYATAKALEYDTQGVFKCGVSVAPVSDWIYYNSIYTERYMSLPSDNPTGYRKGSLLHNVQNLQNKRYLLMHGTGDDNVHFQHAMQFAKVLQRKNILFGQQMYPDEAHGISGSKYHVYRTMVRFWENCFNLP